MQEFLKGISESINKTPYLNLIFLALALMGIILSFVFYYKSIKHKNFSYNLRNFIIIRNKIAVTPELEIFYKKNLIQSLMLTKISFWCSGNLVIDKSDIAEVDPIGIEFSNEISVFDVKIEYQNSFSNNFSVEFIKEKKFIKISFDYMQKNDGVILNIYHNGTSSTHFKVRGSIKGVKRLLNFQDEDGNSKSPVLNGLFKFIDSVFPNRRKKNIIIQFLFAFILLPFGFLAAFIDIILIPFTRPILQTPNKFQILYDDEIYIP